jgi:hypothetical protein
MVSMVKLLTVADLPFLRLTNLRPPEWLIWPARVAPSIWREPRELRHTDAPRQQAQREEKDQRDRKAPPDVVPDD